MRFAVLRCHTRPYLKINILNSCPTQSRVEVWDAMSSKGAGRPRLTHHYKGGWNETKWMRWGWRNGASQAIRGLRYVSFVANSSITSSWSTSKTVDLDLQHIRSWIIVLRDEKSARLKRKWSYCHLCSWTFLYWRNVLVFVGNSSIKFELIFTTKYIFSLARITFTHIIHYLSLCINIPQHV